MCVPTVVTDPPIIEIEIYFHGRLDRYVTSVGDVACCRLPFPMHGIARVAIASRTFDCVLTMAIDTRSHTAMPALMVR